MSVDYIVGDTRDVTATIPDGSVSLVACSPPFIALRSYLPADHPDKDKEIGSEPDPATFLDTLLGLTAEWGRVLAPWGSIAIELGDTFSGSGGENNLYASGYSGGSTYNTQKPPGAVGTRGGEWPMAKSLSLVPQLYAASLAYGRNILTGQPSPAGQWRVRNMIVWHRPNPAVGALGDKYRPCTSYITVATRDSKRWFDLTAVRTPGSRDAGHVPAQPDGATQPGNTSPFRGGMMASNVAGAPPLDCWFDEWDGSHDTWTQTTQPSSIKVKVTEQVQCGPDDGGERTTSPDCPVHGDHAVLAPTEQCDERGDVSSSRTQRSGSRPEQEPTPAAPCGELTSSRSDRPVANGRSTLSNRTGHAPSTNPPGTPCAQTAGGTGRTPASPGSCGSHPGTCESSTCEACRPSGEHETEFHIADTSCQESACTCTFHVEKHSIHSHYAMWPAKLAERLILSMCPAEVCTFCREPRRRVEKAEQVPSRPLVADAHRRAAEGHLTSSGRELRSAETLGWTDCRCGVPFTPGTVLDPFAGAGTTLAVADLHGRNAIGIDIDARNHYLYPARRAEVARNLFGSPIPDPDQLELFGAA